MAESKNLTDISSDDDTDAKSQVKSGENARLARAISEATKEIRPLILPEDSIYTLSKTLDARLKKLALEPGEEVIFMVKQSKLRGLNPGFIIFTNKKIILAQPSVMRFLGDLMAYKSLDFLQYTKIVEVSGKRGTYMRTLSIKVAGETKEIPGIKPQDSELILKFMLKVTEYLET